MTMRKPCSYAFLCLRIQHIGLPLTTIAWRSDSCFTCKVPKL